MGRTVRHSVSALVAPRARLPSRIARGTRARPSSVETMTTGTVNKAMVNEAHNMPGVPNVGAGRDAVKNSSSIVPPRK